MAPLSPQQRRELDDAHSNRSIELDPSGYFLIRIDAAAGELVVEHFGNGINDQGLATDPESGEVLSCSGNGPRAAIAEYRGRSAKELGMVLTESADPLPLSRLDHALYLGRELQKAEHCLEQGLDYVQD